MISTRIHSIVVLTILSATTAVAQQDRRFGAAFAAASAISTLKVGEIVGASYSDGRYMLWATPPAKVFSSIYLDEVVQLSRMALEIGDDKGAGFSLDFGRKASRPFEPTDILQPATFGAMLGSKHPLAVMLRGLPEGVGLGEALVLDAGHKTNNDLLKRAALLLNRARQLDLSRAVPVGSLTQETRALIDSGKADKIRLGRMILEDAFSPVLQRDVEPSYVIQYKPGEISERAAALLNGTKSEAVLLSADAALKFLTAGTVGGEFSIGPPQLLLCGEQARADLLNGKGVHQGEYVDFFSLDLDYERMDQTTGVWMRDARLIAHADGITGGGAPSCATRYAASLTARMPFILRQDGEISQQLRDLKALLALQRAAVFLSNCAPLSPRRLKEFASTEERFANIPPKVVRSPLSVVAGQQAIRLTVSGGILFGNKPAPLPEIPPELVRLPNGFQYEAPGFRVTEVLRDGQPLLRIDMSSILAPL